MRRGLDGRGGRRHGDLCRRVLLVHGARLRQARWRPIGRLGLYTTGHAESVEITYDPAKITYERLLDVFWHNVDPVTANQQFCDHGTQYRSAIFYHDEQQRRLAEASTAALEAEKRFAQPIVTQIVPASIFYPAEEYHQHYYAKNPLRYKYYRYSCGRDQRLLELWGPRAASATH